MLTILYSTENAKFSFHCPWTDSHRKHSYNRGTHPMHEAGTSTTKTQLNSTRGDQGSRTLNKYQMALRNCKGSKREGTNGTLTCCICICNVDFFTFFFVWTIMVSSIFTKLRLLKLNSQQNVEPEFPQGEHFEKGDLKLVRNF